MAPERIQRRRSKGWRTPPDTVYVGRPTRWGNPFPVTPGADRSEYQAAVDAFRASLLRGELGYSVADARPEPGGKNLACWYPPGHPCHADVLLEITNEQGQE